MEVVITEVHRCANVVVLFQGRSKGGNGSFRTRASEASPSLRGCVRVRVGVRVA